MKSIVLFFALVSHTFLYSQLTSDAGLDTTICVTWNTPGALILGGNPAASGGTAPYTYSWECNYNYVVGPNTYILTASVFLSDTTIANPNLIYTVESPVTFILNVTDVLGQISIDTITVSFSIFGTHLLEWTHNMLVGDSVQFVSTPNVGGGTPPFNYLWKPNNGLNDSTSYTNFWVKPEVSTSYYITVTDSVGCVVSGTPVFHVYIGSADLNEIHNKSDKNILLFPNPTDGTLFLKSEEENIDLLQIYNQEGELLLTHNNFKNNEIDISKFENGTYIILISINTETIITKIIKTK